MGLINENYKLRTQGMDWSPRFHIKSYIVYVEYSNTIDFYYTYGSMW